MEKGTNPNLKHEKCAICGSPAVTDVDGEFICENILCKKKILKKLGYIEVVEGVFRKKLDDPRPKMTPEKFDVDLWAQSPYFQESLDALNKAVYRNEQSE